MAAVLDRPSFGAAAVEFTARIGIVDYLSITFVDVDVDRGYDTRVDVDVDCVTMSCAKRASCRANPAFPSDDRRLPPLCIWASLRYRASAAYPSEE